MLLALRMFSIVFMDSIHLPDLAMPVISSEAGFSAVVVGMQNSSSNPTGDDSGDVVDGLIVAELTIITMQSSNPTGEDSGDFDDLIVAELTIITMQSPSSR